jgi:hypothetical protein
VWIVHNFIICNKMVFHAVKLSSLLSTWDEKYYQEM